MKTPGFTKSGSLKRDENPLCFFKIGKMIKMNKSILLIFLIVLLAAPSTTFAGNPDRQGEAGAPELMMNPWARSAGLHSMTTAFVSGVEAMRINIAGLSRINKTELVAGYANYLDGTGISMNALGLSQKMGENGAFGISIMSLDFGDIPVTTTTQPDGTGTTFSPSWFNIGFGYSHTFENKVSVGILFRGVFESTSDISASGIGIDAGVQYVTGPKDNFKFGIAIRNVGTRLKFGGEALSQQVVRSTNDNPDGTNITVRVRVEDFELPSLLNMGISYDLYPSDDYRFRVLANFTANSFSRDQIGGGVEFAMKEMFFIRGGYNLEFGQTLDDAGNEIQESIYDGLSMGVGIEAPFKKGKPTKFGIDYAYRSSNPFSGTHNVSLRLSI